MGTQSRQMVKAFLATKAMEFINKSQAVPCSRKSRRAVARDIAKRYMVNLRAEEAQRANV